jgi:PAS domain S-box-containing protein
MALPIRSSMVKTGLVLLAGTALGGLLAYRGTGTPLPWAGLAAVAGVLVLAVLPTWIGVRSGNVGRMAAELRDKIAALIDERNKRQALELALERCAQRERMLSTAVQSTRHPIVLLTPEGTIRTWNPGAERLYGFTAAEAIGNNVEVIIPADRRDEHLAVLERSLKGETIESFETVRVAKDGRRIDISLSLRPVKSSTGEVVEVAKITRDLTEQKFAEEKFHMAVESCPSGMVMVDRLGKIVMVNTETERLFGHRRHELIGQSVDILVPARLRGQHVRHRDGFTRLPEARRMGA